jgi:predicted nucleic acid-binding protein
LIAADTSTWVAYLAGVLDSDTNRLREAIQGRQLLMPPAVLTELISNPALPADIAQALLEVPLIEVRSGFWLRAGQLRAKVLARRRKARLGDALIAQCCIDRGVPLLTRDSDFQAFAETAELELVAGL